MSEETREPVRLLRKFAFQPCTSEIATAMKQLSVIVPASATAGLISRMFCHPFDTAKARIQGPSSAKVFNSTGHALRVTFAEEGIRGLYRGFGAVTVGGIPATVLYLGTYELTKQVLHGSGFFAYFCGGMIAETVSCIVFVPVDVVKERLQVQRQGVADASMNYKGSVDAIRTIMRTEGLRGIYKGYGATLLSFGPFSATYFLAYETLKKWAAKQANTTVETLPFPHLTTCATVAGSLASWITNPLDLAKLRLQVARAQAAGVGTGEVYTGFWQSLQFIYKVEGWKGLFRGSTARIMFHAPMQAITMVSYEQCKRIFQF